MKRFLQQPDTIKRADYLETLAKGLALLRLYGPETTELEIQDAADRLGLSRAAARRFLLTLESLGFLAREGRGFRLTPEILKLGYSYFSSMDLPGIARPILKSLVDVVDEACGLNILHKDEIVYLGGVASQVSFNRQLNAGATLPAYPTAAGRVLLAGLSDDELEGYLKRVEFRKFTPYTVADRDVLRKAVKKAGKDGYSIVQNELLYGVCGLAVPIIDQDGKVVAAIHMSLMHGLSLKSMVQSYLPHLQEAAAEIGGVLRATRGLPG